MQSNFEIFSMNSHIHFTLENYLSHQLFCQEVILLCRLSFHIHNPWTHRSLVFSFFWGLSDESIQMPLECFAVKCKNMKEAGSLDSMWTLSYSPFPQKPHDTILAWNYFLCVAVALQEPTFLQQITKSLLLTSTTITHCRYDICRQPF